MADASPADLGVDGGTGERDGKGRERDPDGSTSLVVEDVAFHGTRF